VLPAEVVESGVVSVPDILVLLNHTHHFGDPIFAKLDHPGIR
jgi:hypothetical protein